MSGAFDPADRCSPDGQPHDDESLRIVARPCPLCRESIEVVEHQGAQRVTCGACGLTCTVDATPPAPPLAILEIVTNVAPVDGEAAVVKWLERPPRPLQPHVDLDAEARDLRERRKRRIAVTAEALAATMLVVAIAWRFGYVRASYEAARRGSEARSAAAAKEAQLLTIKQQLELERQAAELKREAAERQTRLVTSKYLAEQAIDISRADPWRGVSLATQAVKTTLNADSLLVPEAHQSLRDALARLSDVDRIDGIPLRGHTGSVNTIAASPDGRWLATGSADHAVRLWDLYAAGGQNHSIVLNHHSAQVTNVLFSADGHWLFTGSLDSNVCVWDMRKISPGSRPVILPGREQPISFMAISASGRWLATITASSSVNPGLARLWDLEGGPQRATSLKLTGQGGRIQAVALSPDSRWLAIGVDDAIRMWDLNCRMPTMASLDRHCLHGAVTSVLFSPDGRWLISSGQGGNGAVQLWNLAAADPTTSVILRGSAAPTRVLAASPDSRWLVTIGKDETISLWDLQTSSPSVRPLTLSNSASPLSVGAVSGDGRWLAAADQSGNVLLWELSSSGPSKPAVLLHTGDGRLASLAFTADSRWLATGGDQTARLWNLNVPELVQRASVLARVHGQSGADSYAWLACCGSALARVFESSPLVQGGEILWNSGQTHTNRLYAQGKQLVATLTNPQFAPASVAVANPDAPPIPGGTPLPPVNEPLTTLIVSSGAASKAAEPRAEPSHTPSSHEASILVSSRRPDGAAPPIPATITGSDRVATPPARTAASGGNGAVLR